jgi:hypothetical protein
MRVDNAAATTGDKPNATSGSSCIHLAGVDMILVAAALSWPELVGADYVDYDAGRVVAHVRIVGQGCHRRVPNRSVAALVYPHDEPERSGVLAGRGTEEPPDARRAAALVDIARRAGRAGTSI